MKQISSAFLFLLLLGFFAGAAGSILRINCAGDDGGAEVMINNEFIGACPIDIEAPLGAFKLDVHQEVGYRLERVFEQDFPAGVGAVSEVEVKLSALRLTAIEQKLHDQSLADERAEAARFDSRSRAQFDVALASGAIQRTFQDCADCPEMVVIPAGRFEMGSSAGADDAKPVHQVEIVHSFAMGKAEVTQGQWEAIMGSNPSVYRSCGYKCPVNQVSWDEANEFILKLNAKTGKQYRLPSEAEWEYAARAGSTSALPWGAQPSYEYANLRQVDCCGVDVKNGRDQWIYISPSGSFPANALGLFDMIGDVWEWTEDSYHSNYIGAPTDGSAWVVGGAQHVVRGGSWTDEVFANVADRAAHEAEFDNCNLGFRLAMMLP